MNNKEYYKQIIVNLVDSLERISDIYLEENFSEDSYLLVQRLTDRMSEIKYDCMENEEFEFHDFSKDSMYLNALMLITEDYKSSVSRISKS